MQRNYAADKRKKKMLRVLLAVGLLGGSVAVGQEVDTLPPLQGRAGTK